MLITFAPYLIGAETKTTQTSSGLAYFLQRVGTISSPSFSMRANTTPSSAASRPTLQGQSAVLWSALGYGARAFLLSLAVVVLGGAPSSPLIPSSSTVAPRFGFVAAAAVAPAATPTDYATTNKQQQAEREEEQELYAWYDASISSAGRPLRLERNLQPAVEEEETLEADAPDLFMDSGSDLSVLLEGCTLPAQATSVRAKHDKPTKGNIADNAVDGDPSTW